ncbi:MAG: 2Fe-2S iron-sulfur cluster-binding protein [Nitrospiria bacterium]
MSVTNTQSAASETIAVEIMGKKYRIPPGLTMLQAMWHTGHELVRGVGCLGAVCGACPTTYRTQDDTKIKTTLACQTQVEDGMSFSLTASYYPDKKVVYDFDAVEDPKQDLFRYYPEAALCRNCDACTVACPKDIDVRTGVWKAVFGDFKDASDIFLSCVMCSLCVPVCIADIAPNQVGLYARRAQGIFFEEKKPQLSLRVKEIAEGKFDAEWERLLALSDEAIQSESLI